MPLPEPPAANPLGREPDQNPDRGDAPEPLGGSLVLAEIGMALWPFQANQRFRFTIVMGSGWVVSKTAERPSRPSTHGE